MVVDAGADEFNYLCIKKLLPILLLRLLTVNVAVIVKILSVF